MPPVVFHNVDERTRTLPLRSITASVPPSSPHTGCSMKAMRSPFGEMRALLIQVGVS
jgi:hypothetical protein